jgi:protein O-GlcNAc transferase
MPTKNILTRSKKQKALALYRSNQLAQAVALYEQVCRTDPRDSEAWCALGAIHGMLENFEEAIHCGERAILIRPDYAEAHSNLSAAYEAVGRYPEAATSARRALDILPDYPDAQLNHGNALRRLGQFEEAIVAYQQVVRRRPADEQALFNLGLAHSQCGQLVTAEEYYRAALHAKPDYAEAYNNLGTVLRSLGDDEGAARQFRAALKFKPDHAGALNNLGVVLARQGHLQEGIELFQSALRIQPEFADALTNLGSSLKDQGRYREALEAFRKALSIDPDLPAANTSLLFCLNYDPNQRSDTVFSEHGRWGETYTGFAQYKNYPNSRNPDRKIKVGYVSPDFRRHSVAHFLEGILASHDANDVDVYCYAQVPSPDDVTERFKRLAAHWRDSYGISDSKLCEQIREDRIDILVDLAGHTAGNRLPVFARKPAPIQITYLGYPNTTGLSTIDYRLTDSLADPPGQEAFHTETLIRLRQGFLCYTPPAKAPPVGPPPAERNKYVSFGSFNALPKINAGVISLWAKFLKAVPGSRLVLKNKSLRDDSTLTRYADLFQQHGIEPDRLDLIGWLPDINDHLTLYNKIDVALDTFPYNGTTTTCEALWMGVPVVTLAGNRHAGRVGVSLLNQVCLPELIANSTEQYRKIAAELAGNLDRLAVLKFSLRERVANSPLCDGKTFTRQLEQAYREMWERWCMKDKNKT